MNIGSEATRCPICGLGVVVDVAYDAGASRDDGAPMQGADTRQVTTYTCGHTSSGGSLATADTDVLDVETRSSDETVDPSPTD